MATETKPASGRPRTFDTHVALERALEVFWAQGFDGASLTDLTDAMGITKTSMYAAFGNKEQLFRKALDLYTVEPASYGERALKEPTAQAVVTSFLNGTVRATTRPDCPSGCLAVQGSLASGKVGQPARHALVKWRNDARLQIEARFQRAIEEGDLPRDADAARLAYYVSTVSFGIAVQAASGASRSELQDVADMALSNWPGN